ncbi:hypothetical protein AAW12_23730 [Sphingobacterium sp. Ag1]|uniref:hypothetical protein n=1 Tax=Sphingobacterium sp. Ag1 TaxID=1643451 RepID=UPI000627EEE2|nr:hypothetical protein [Sphingobacterium sp. Ag1]KKO89145.1 hypothetical protein AAW12_23730 [Sphingobacterium sp. Ag1]
MDTLIQIVILICLILVIALLLVDKVKIVRTQSKVVAQKEIRFPDVVGKVVNPVKEKTPAWLANRKKLVEKIVANNAKQENTDSNKNAHQKEHNSVADRKEFDDEDDVPPDDDRFGQAVSLNELTKVGNLLQQDNLDSAQEKEATDIIQKIEGTELFAMMQQSIEGASQKIARLLDKSLLEKHNVIQKENQSNEVDNFDIGDFI